MLRYGVLVGTHVPALVVEAGQAAIGAAMRPCSAAFANYLNNATNLAVAQVLVETLESMKLQYPKPAADLSKIQFE